MNSWKSKISNLYIIQEYRTKKSEQSSALVYVLYLYELYELHISEELLRTWLVDSPPEDREYIITNTGIW